MNRPNQPTGVLCPYCGAVSRDTRRCGACAGHFDPLSRQATQNAMGPWFIREEGRPHRPGCSFETLRTLIQRGRVTPTTVLRGPTTRQFWTLAGRAPSVANLLGLCHNCRAEVNPDEYSCRKCGAVFTPETDRQHMGLGPVHLLPGQAAPEAIAASVGEPGAGVVQAGRDGAEVEPVDHVLKVRIGRLHAAIALLLVGVLGLAAALAVVVAGPMLGIDLGLGAGSAAVTSEPEVEGEVPVTGGDEVPSPAAPEQARPRAGPPEPENAEAPDAEADLGLAAPPTEVQPDRHGAVYQTATLASLVMPALSREPMDAAGVAEALATWQASNPGRAGEADAWAALAARRAEQQQLRRLP